MIDALPLLLGPEGYQISRSVRLRSSASAYFNRTLTTPTSNTTWSWSGWVKLGQLGTTRQLFGGAGTNYGAFGFESTDQIRFWNNAGTGVASSTAVFRDPSAWYHVAVISNGTTIKAYINNFEVLSYTGTITNINSAIAHQIGRFGGLTYYTDGYLTEINFIDGQALTPASFGETNPVTGVWQPKKYAGTYGTNGFYLNFSDPSAATAAAIGKDNSGNGNNWTPNNISVTAGVTYDSMLDVPTQWADGGNGRGNYAVLNPLNKATSDISLSSGNLEASSSFTSDHRCFASTFQVTSGKWYWEVQYATGTINAGSNIVGIFNLPTPDTANNRRPADSVNNGIGIRQDGQSESDNTSAAYFGSSISVGDIIGIKLDADAGTVAFNVNGGSFGSTLTFVSAGGVYTPGGDIRASSGTPKTIHNFGQRPFAYTPPTGFKALNTLNLPTPTILKGNQYFDATTYTGTGAARSIVNSGAMQPDLIWIKDRSVASAHALTNSVTGITKYLESNTTAAETTDTTSVTAINSDGFSLGAGTATYYTNRNGESFVAWQWNAGGSNATNTNGTVTSTVRANPSAGFSIVTYTAPASGNFSVGHGLNAPVAMVITKSRGATFGWWVWHRSLASQTNSYLGLHQTNAVATLSAIWGAGHDSTVTGGQAGASGSEAASTASVRYVFSEVAGFSKFGSYTGNNSTDGPFVFCGFRPRFVMVKCSSNAGTNWEIWDAERNNTNQMTNYLVPNSSAAEQSASFIDFLSNGFKIRSTQTEVNGSGYTMIFAAFAESPFKNSLAR